MADETTGGNLEPLAGSTSSHSVHRSEDRDYTDLASLEETYGPAGLQVIGIFHPKPPGQWTMEQVRRATDEKHFTFPIAIDGNWSALKVWWPTTQRAFTSVSFLLDQNGMIRYVHPGGEFHDGQHGGMSTHEACNRDMQFIRGEIVKLLSGSGS
jgi:hypothetical protein